MWSFWDNKFLGTTKGTWTTPALEGWACQHLVFTPIDGAAASKPVLIGSDLHISSGVAEIKDVAASPDGIKVVPNRRRSPRWPPVFPQHQTLKLQQASGLEASPVEAAGENVWSVEVRARKAGTAQSLELAAP